MDDNSTKELKLQNKQLLHIKLRPTCTLKLCYYNVGMMNFPADSDVGLRLSQVWWGRLGYIVSGEEALSW